MAGKKEKLDDLDQANAEIEKLRKLGEKLTGELQGNVVNTACIYDVWYMVSQSNPNYSKMQKLSKYFGTLTQRTYVCINFFAYLKVELRL